MVVMRSMGATVAASRRDGSLAATGAASARRRRGNAQAASPAVAAAMRRVRPRGATTRGGHRERCRATPGRPATAPPGRRFAAPAWRRMRLWYTFAAMPDYSKLHDLISHRVSIEYDTGARVTGYLQSCQPAAGPVEFVVLSDAKLVDSHGRVVRETGEITLCPNVLTGFSMDEGPRGRDRG
jgi:small nuclear ribonucleoprotein (snRNP)-like protein